METFSALMAVCEGNLLVTVRYPYKDPMIVWLVVFRYPYGTVEQTYEFPMIWVAVAIMWRHCD